MSQSIENMSGEEFMKYLEYRLSELLKNIDQSKIWQLLSDEKADLNFINVVMKEVYLEIFSYQTDVVESSIAMVGQMPRSIDPKLIQTMLIHQAEEFDHGEMALKDYIRLGGNEKEAREGRMSPESFAVAGVWWMMARKRDPFAFLGALYLFEGLTPIVTARAAKLLKERGFNKEALEFILFHAEVDIRHEKLLRMMIIKIVEQFPEAKESMVYGLDCFLKVYPLAVWDGAYDRALKKFK